MMRFFAVRLAIARLIAPELFKATSSGEVPAPHLSATHLPHMQILTLVELLAAHRGRHETTVVLWAGGHSRLFYRLKSGAGCNLRTAEKLVDWFDRNWPDDLEWPADITRPSTVTKRRAA